MVYLNRKWVECLIGYISFFVLLAILAMMSPYLASAQTTYTGYVCNEGISGQFNFSCADCGGPVYSYSGLDCLYIDTVEHDLTDEGGVLWCEDRYNCGDLLIQARTLNGGTCGPLGSTEYSCNYNSFRCEFNRGTGPALVLGPWYACGGDEDRADDFTISVSPPAPSISQGQNQVFTVSLQSQNNFSGTVNVTATCPQNATCTRNPLSGDVALSAGGSGSLTYTIGSTEDVNPAAYGITFTGTSGSLSHTANATLTVNPAASTSVVQGYKVNNDATLSPFSAVPVTISSVGPTSRSSSANPFFLTQLVAGSYQIRSTQPAGYNVQYSFVSPSGGLFQEQAFSNPGFRPGISAPTTVGSNQTIDMRFRYVGGANNAACGAFSAPATVAAGQSFAASVTMNNTGTRGWAATALVGSTVSHKLGSQNAVAPYDNNRWGPGRVELPSNFIAPGTPAVFNFTASAPANPASTAGCTASGGGNYSCLFKWGMVEESYEWFGSSCQSNITITPAVVNTPPSVPTIQQTTGTPGSGTVNTSYNFRFYSTDPQGDQIRYGIDWNLDNVADEWLPAGVSYVNSGTAQTTGHSWSTTGTQGFRALAQDAPGLNSAWSNTFNMNITAPPPPPPPPSTTYELSIIKSGQGTVVNNPLGSACDTPSPSCFKYDEGTAVTLSANPSTGRVFTGWGGDCSGTPRTSNCTIIMNGNKSVLANFAIDPTFREF